MDDDYFAAASIRSYSPIAIDNEEISGENRHLDKQIRRLRASKNEIQSMLDTLDRLNRVICT